MDSGKQHKTSRDKAGSGKHKESSNHPAQHPEIPNIEVAGKRSY
jgi:hypothetical protein